MAFEMERVVTGPVKPRRLKPGDTVGIASPAAAFFPVHQQALDRALECLRSFGFTVRIAEHTLQERAHLNPPAKQRAEDLNALFADPEVAAIFCLCGGTGTNALLPLLDWESIQSCPKVLMGYSAVTALLLGVHAHAGLVTFHGPMILDGFSEYPGLLPYTRGQLERVLLQTEPPGALRPPAECTADYPRNDAPRQMKANLGWRWLRPGKARGRLVGGNLRAMLTLAATMYWPSFRERILFFEEVHMGGEDLQWLEESLAQCQQLGLFDEISGLVVGKINDLTAEEETLLAALVREYAGCGDFPVLAQVDLGHTDPKLVLPIGVQASLDSDRDLFSLDEGAVI